MSSPLFNTDDSFYRTLAIVIGLPFSCPALFFDEDAVAIYLERSFIRIVICFVKLLYKFELLTPCAISLIECIHPLCKLRGVYNFLQFGLRIKCCILDVLRSTISKRDLMIHCI
jgi:hypothetical protein